jgi:hypothetical protein
MGLRKAIPVMHQVVSARGVKVLVNGMREDVVKVVGRLGSMVVVPVEDACYNNRSQTCWQVSPRSQVFCGVDFRPEDGYKGGVWCSRIVKQEMEPRDGVAINMYNKLSCHQMFQHS